MVDVELHAEFHTRLDVALHNLEHVEATADEALEKAERASNVLFQNNID